MDEWLSTGNASLNLNQQIFKMDTTCNENRQFGFDGQFCIITDNNNNNNNNLLINISSGVGGTILIIIILISVIIISGYCIYKKRRPHKR